ncbi:hypothetical protein NEMIN01_0224 [Nematocida minor]|uniref:uncharacterized protein n=1 Tax=Nematocida minor TaxID=1912983 RepID=UPI0022206D58|nr:uncharacterized protein NEMIN01_0224 [Nematocida minor]KAI5188960.1 hypothetical protein NEMIN01_0224 [Nematocida minor]
MKIINFVVGAIVFIGLIISIIITPGTSYILNNPGYNELEQAYNPGMEMRSENSFYVEKEDLYSMPKERYSKPYTRITRDIAESNETNNSSIPSIFETDYNSAYNDILKSITVSENNSDGLKFYSFMISSPEFSLDFYRRMLELKIDPDLNKRFEYTTAYNNTTINNIEAQIKQEYEISNTFRLTIEEILVKICTHISMGDYKSLSRNDYADVVKNIYLYKTQEAKNVLSQADQWKTALQNIKNSTFKENPIYMFSNKDLQLDIKTRYPDLKSIIINSSFADMSIKNTYNQIINVYEHINRIEYFMDPAIIDVCGLKENIEKVKKNSSTVMKDVSNLFISDEKNNVQVENAIQTIKNDISAYIAKMESFIQSFSDKNKELFTDFKKKIENSILDKKDYERFFKMQIKHLDFELEYINSTIGRIIDIDDFDTHDLLSKFYNENEDEKLENCSRIDLSEVGNIEPIKIVYTSQNCSNPPEQSLQVSTISEINSTTEETPEVTTPQTNASEETPEVTTLKVNDLEEIPEVTTPQTNASEETPEATTLKVNDLEEIPEVTTLKVNDLEETSEVTTPKTNYSSTLKKVLNSDIPDTNYPSSNEDSVTSIIPKNNTNRPEKVQPSTSQDISSTTSNPVPYPSSTPSAPQQMNSTKPSTSDIIFSTTSNPALPNKNEFNASKPIESADKICANSANHQNSNSAGSLFSNIGSKILLVPILSSTYARYMQSRV